MRTPTAAIDQIASAVRHDVLAVASSAGGIRALSSLLGSLPADLPVPVLVVQHLDRTRHTIIAEVLGRRTELVVKLAEHESRSSQAWSTSRRPIITS
jgi:two-component system chemotaxis response regulator CheB